MPNEALANKVIAVRTQNYNTMQQYTWTVQTQIIKDGNTKDTKIQQVTYGPGGVPQYTLLNDVGAPMPRGFFRKAAAENEKKELEKFLKGLEQLVGQYTLPTPGSMVQFLASATLMQGQDPSGKAILQTTGSSVIVPGDTLSLTVDAATYAFRRVEITTFYEGQEATISATYRTMPSGLTHMQYATVTVPSQSITVMVHNYDYMAND